MSGWDKMKGQLGKKFSGKSNGELFMKLPDGKHKVRLVGEPRGVDIVWHNGKKLIVPNIPGYREKVQDILGEQIRSSIVVNVIDRADQAARLKNGECTRFKLLEKGRSIFDTILTHYEEVLDDDGNKVHPGGPNGLDWRIIADVPQDVRNTQYKIVPLGRAKFTEEELSVMKRADKHGKNVKEEYKDLEIGTRGLIDLDLFFDDSKAQEKMDEYLAEQQGGASSSSSEDDVFGGEGSDAKATATASESESDPLDDLF